MPSFTDHAGYRLGRPDPGPGNKLSPCHLFTRYTPDVKAPAPFRAVSSNATRVTTVLSIPPSSGRTRSSVLQGVFVARPFSFHAINPGANSAQPSSVQMKPTIQRRPGVNAFQVDLRPKSGGWPLPRDVQGKMEAALGANFSDVRVHVGPEAAAIGAVAFTWGSDLHFAPGQYNPHTPHGQFLLGHELAHVMQQRAGRVANPFGAGVAVVQDQALETEADRLGRMASTSRAHETGNSNSAPSAERNSGRARNAVVTMKAKALLDYALQAPRPNGSGWDIQVGAQGALQPVGSLQLTATKDRVYISNLKVAPEHRRQGLAGQLVDAALRTARSNGFRVAQLEARPDSYADVAPSALVSMYRKLGFQVTGISQRGNPLMERRT